MGRKDSALPPKLPGELPRPLERAVTGAARRLFAGGSESGTESPPRRFPPHTGSLKMVRADRFFLHCQPDILLEYPIIIPLSGRVYKGDCRMCGKNSFSFSGGFLPEHRLGRCAEALGAGSRSARLGALRHRPAITRRRWGPLDGVDGPFWPAHPGASAVCSRTEASDLCPRRTLALGDGGSARGAGPPENCAQRRGTGPPEREMSREQYPGS